MDKSEGVLSISVEQFLSHRTERFVEEAFCTSKIFRYRFCLWIRTREYQKFPSIRFIKTEPKTLCGGSFLFFRKTPVSKISLDKRRLYQEFCSKSFCLTAPKKIVGEPLYVSEKTRSQKKFGKKVGVVSQFFNGCFFVAQYLKSL